MLEQLMNSPNFNYLARGMEAASVRQEVISNNIANVNTPNFNKSDVIFEDLLAKELKMDEPGELQVIRTHDRHFPIISNDPARAYVQEDEIDIMRVDKNNVDIDIEMANLAKNSLYYNALANQMAGYVTKLKNVITSGQS